MLYEKPSFTVPASSVKSPDNCAHGWTDSRGRCVLCGVKAPIAGVITDVDPGNRTITVGYGRRTHLDFYVIAGTDADRYRTRHDEIFGSRSNHPTHTLPGSEIVPLRSSCVTE